MKKYLFKTIYTGLTTIHHGVITVTNDGKIHSVKGYDKKEKNVIKDFQEQIAMPGFIDIHNHGGYGIDFMNTDIENIEKLMTLFPKEGITTVIPTIGAMENQKIIDFIQLINTYINNKKTGFTDIKGTNIEGPFLNPMNVGLQPEGALALPNLDHLKNWIELSEGNMKLMTIAPELPGAIECIEELTKNKIIASAGHSNANTIEITKAIEAGCNQVTHLFNGMRGLHHRELGILGVALCNDNIYAEMAGFDTYSIHPDIWKMAFKLKGPNRMILSTDALTLKGLPDGNYTMMDREVKIKNGRLYTEYEGGEMHPGVPMMFIDSVKNTLRYTGATIEDIVIMSAVNPAKQCNIFDCKGSLSINKDADFIVLDEHFNLSATFCLGNLAYQSK